MNPFIAIAWGITLIVSFLGVVPAAVMYLNRILNAARRIEQYTIEIQAAGAGIARNTASTVALGDTISTATMLLDGAQAIERDTASIEQSLAARARGDGRAGAEKAGT